jgi:hypothetical protein
MSGAARIREMLSFVPTRSSNKYAAMRMIASEVHPILDSKLIAKLRREGKLPDKFVCGRCQYDLRGDPGAAYYVKTCR